MRHLWGPSGNSETTTLGADFQMHRRWPVWQIEATASAVNTTDRGTTTAERYLGSFRAKRTLTPVVSFTAGERAERDPLAGIDFRSITDAGLSYALVRDPQWTLDGLTSLAWNHENAVLGGDLDDPSRRAAAPEQGRFQPDRRLDATIHVLSRPANRARRTGRRLRSHFKPR